MAAEVDPHSAVNRLNRLVYSTQVGQPFKLTEESRTICGRNKERQGLSVGFDSSMGPPHLVQHYPLNTPVSLVWKMDTIRSFTDLWKEAISHLV